MEEEIVERVIHWYHFWPLALILLMMAGTVWLIKKGEEEEDRLRAEGKLPFEEQGNNDTKENDDEQDQ